MSIWLKRSCYAVLIFFGCLVLLGGFLRLQAFQYLAAYLGYGFANSLPAASTNKSSTPLSCSSQPLNVLTFNVQYGSDLIEAARQPFLEFLPGSYLPWSKRFPEIRQRITGYDPDLIGLQEMHTDQDIANIVPLAEYSLSSYHLGKFEYGDAALLYKTKRFEKLDSGQLWLSPNSTLPLSLGYKPFAMIRYVNWAKLRDKSNGFTFLFVNTHFDNNPLNKDKSSELFYQQIAKLTAFYPMIVTGDFNSTAITERYQRLRGSTDQPPLLVNTYELVEKPIKNPTAHPDHLIDHILVGGPCKTSVLSWDVDTRTLSSGDTLSDHNAVIAKINFSER